MYNEFKTLREMVGEKVYNGMNLRKRQLHQTLYSNKSATLVLGAGINASINIPTWPTLLARLSCIMASTDFHHSDIYPSTTPFTSDAFYNAPEVFSKSDVLEVAEYIYSQISIKHEPTYPIFSVLSNSNSFESYQDRKLGDLILKDMVRAALMPNPNSVKEDIFSYDKLKNETVGKVGDLIANRFFCRPDRCILSYNFDNLVEHYLIERNKSLNHPDSHIIPQPIYRKNGEIVEPKSDSNVLIYHPHGYLSLPGTYSYNNKHTDESDSLILSESSYYEQERYCYSWENSILSHALINGHCIFFGWSGTDYSFRRILKNLEPRAKKIENRKQVHYLIITVNSMYNTLLKHARALSSISEDDYVKNKMPAYLALKEEYWKSYGFLPIWTTYEELPKLIDELWI